MKINLQAKCAEKRRNTKSDRGTKSNKNEVLWSFGNEKKIDCCMFLGFLDE
jgi:hypothetical protein